MGAGVAGFSNAFHGGPTSRNTSHGSGLVTSCGHPPTDAGKAKIGEEQLVSMRVRSNPDMGEAFSGSAAKDHTTGILGMN